ncbi:MAG: DsbA family oxidoreductase [Dysgonomonas sp.]|nr:DsbA family oxidoreductase [Dysgonomonas sp.]
MEKMKIEIWSDIACPYCYIGKRKLEKALEQFPHKDSVELVWHSYELDPNLPKEALESKIYGYFADKYNLSVNEAHQNMENVTALAKEVGLNYDFDNLQVANTSDALRLIKLAGESNLATEAEEVLFDAYFVRGKDISNKETLIDLGTRIGLDKDSIEKMLASNKYLADIQKDIEYGENELGLEYIPLYLFNNKQIIQGSIASEDYLRVLTEAYSEWEQHGVSNEKGDIITGQSCSIDGICS